MTLTSAAGVGGARRHRFHCSYHKCLTRYASRIFTPLFTGRRTARGTYHHFRSHLDRFYGECDRFRVASINNHALDLDRFDDVRVTRFVRDPRDLVISGYFYHKAGREPWCNIVGPKDDDLIVVNGTVPSRQPRDMSFAQFLNSSSVEEGLVAEIEFRLRHFDSMLLWPVDDKRVKTFRYEEIIGHEVRTFWRIFQFLGLPLTTYPGGLARAYLLSTARVKHRIPHVRNPDPGQWRALFTPSVTRFFNARHGELIERLNYD